MGNSCVGLSVDEHQTTCKLLRQIVLKLRVLSHLLRGRYPSNHPTRLHADAAVHDMQSLRVALEGQAFVEHPTDVVAYLTDPRARVGPRPESVAQAVADAGDGVAFD